MRRTLRNLLVLTSLGGCPLIAQAETSPTVVELFTSQGCSSCPPADAYMGELAQRPDVLALTFHVDYWDDLGWRDRFGLPEAVARQRVYASTLHLSSVFTPQAVIDGKVSYVGSDRSAIGRALVAPRHGTVTRLAIGAEDLLIELDAQKNFPPTDVLLIPYQNLAVSPIGRGENSGRTLKEYNIVRAVHSMGEWDGTQKQFHVSLATLPPDATDVAVVIQSRHQAAILGAASVSLGPNRHTAACDTCATSRPTAYSSNHR